MCVCVLITKTDKQHFVTVSAACMYSSIEVHSFSCFSSGSMRSCITSWLFVFALPRIALQKYQVLCSFLGKKMKLVLEGVDLVFT